MDTNQILITFLTSCVPAFLVYLANKYQTDSKIKELKAQSESELQRLEKEHELKLDALKQSQQVDITSKFFTGELDINKLTQAVNGITELQKAVDKLPK
ncbi:hypothetical protein [Streptococcus infantis]|jgi:hypothetical protein|uniref:hypothetical protein n=1 Tax=Streptococcus infantis TaxID=68892 RepID=UPI0020584EA6|nr:MAG TPA: hypothetical protein [Caudoviricetes sp.]